MFYVNRTMRYFTARQEIPTAAVRPRNDIIGGAVQDGTININLPHVRFQVIALFVRCGQPSTTTVIARSRPYGGDVAISGKEVSIFLYTN